MRAERFRERARKWLSGRGAAIYIENDVVDLAAEFSVVEQEAERAAFGRTREACETAFETAWENATKAGAHDNAAIDAGVEALRALTFEQVCGGDDAESQ